MISMEMLYLFFQTIDIIKREAPIILKSNYCAENSEPMFGVFKYDNLCKLRNVIIRIFIASSNVNIRFYECPESSFNLNKKVMALRLSPYQAFSICEELQSLYIFNLNLFSNPKVNIDGII